MFTKIFCNKQLKTNLHFNLIESLSIVYTNNTADHLRNNNHISEMCLHNLWFFHRRGLFLGLSQFLYQSQGFPFQPSGETSSCTSMY